MSSKNDVDRLSQTLSQAFGFAGGVGAIAGAAVGGAYLSPQTAGPVQIAAWIAGGAVVGGALSVFGVYTLTRFLGRRRVVLAFVGMLITALTAMGAVGGYVFSEGHFIAAIGGAVMLFVTNTLLFVSTRDRWLGKRVSGDLSVSKPTQDPRPQ